MRNIAILAVGISVLLAASSSTGNGGKSGLSSWCGSDAWIGVPSAHILVCPRGDGPSLADIGATITVQVVSDQCDTPPSFPPEDIYVLGCDNAWTTLCVPVYAAVDADGPTDENGITTISGAIRAGGFGTGLWVMVRGQAATGECFCGAEPICLPLSVVSPDINGDLVVDLTDLGLFANAWPPLPYSAPSDLNGDGVIDIIDFSLFAQHFLHGC
jgi:hypothetical protein